MPINGLAVLSDVIFELAMTSMIFAIDLPTAEDVGSTEELLVYFENRPPGTIIYLLSFLLVAVYWFKHIERFKYYKKTNATHQWIEIGFLAFLSWSYTTKNKELVSQNISRETIRSVKHESLV